MLSHEKIFNRAVKRLRDDNRKYARLNNQRHLMTSEIEQIVHALDICGFLTRGVTKSDTVDQWNDPTWRVEEDGRKIGSASVNLDYTIQLNLTRMSLCEVMFANEWANALEAAGTFAIFDRIDSNSGSPPDPLALDYSAVEEYYPGLNKAKEAVIRPVNSLQANRPGTPLLDDEAIDLMAHALFEENLIYTGLPLHDMGRYGKAPTWSVNCKDDTDGEIELWRDSIFFTHTDTVLKDGLHAIMVARAIKAAAKLHHR